VLTTEGLLGEEDFEWLIRWC